MSDFITFNKALSCWICVQNTKNFFSNCLTAKAIYFFAAKRQTNQNIEMVTLSKDPAYKMGIKMKMDVMDFSLTLGLRFSKKILQWLVIWPWYLKKNLESRSLHILYLHTILMWSMTQTESWGKMVRRGFSNRSYMTMIFHL